MLRGWGRLLIVFAGAAIVSWIGASFLFEAADWNPNAAHDGPRPIDMLFGGPARRVDPVPEPPPGWGGRGDGRRQMPPPGWGYDDGADGYGSRYRQSPPPPRGYGDQGRRWRECRRGPDGQWLCGEAEYGAPPPDQRGRRW